MPRSWLKQLAKVVTCLRPSLAFDEELDKKIYNVSREYKISILPITPNFDIDNLYPLTDHVELWNTFVVGNDKTYILASVNDPHIVIPRVDDLPNNRGKNMLPDELYIMFDTLWTKTLQGKQLQFYMVWNSKLYFMNTYPFFNGKGKVIGAILFMRAFETMPETRFTTLEGYLVPVRHSTERQDAGQIGAAIAMASRAPPLAPVAVAAPTAGAAEDTQQSHPSPHVLPSPVVDGISAAEAAQRARTVLVAAARTGT